MSLVNLPPRSRLVGVNHIAIEVGDVDGALAFYGDIFSFSLRKRSENAAFIDMGDQFLVLVEDATPHRDRERHFGLVVDNRAGVRERAQAAGATVPTSRFLDFLDPWGNFIQVVEYRSIQFSKRPEVLRGMGLADLDKTEEALVELMEKGMAY